MLRSHHRQALFTLRRTPHTPTRHPAPNSGALDPRGGRWSEGAPRCTSGHDGGAGRGHPPAVRGSHRRVGEHPRRDGGTVSPPATRELPWTSCRWWWWCVTTRASQELRALCPQPSPCAPAAAPRRGRREVASLMWPLCPFSRVRPKGTRRRTRCTTRPPRCPCPWARGTSGALRVRQGRRLVLTVAVVAAAQRGVLSSRAGAHGTLFFPFQPSSPGPPPPAPTLPAPRRARTRTWAEEERLLSTHTPSEKGRAQSMR